MLELLQDPQNPDNLKELKGSLGNRSWDDFLGVLNDVYLTHLDMETQFRDEHEALRIKYSDLKKRLKQPEREQTSVTVPGSDPPPALAGHATSPAPEPEPERPRKKLTEPGVFTNKMDDQSLTWDKWYTDVIIRL